MRKRMCVEWQQRDERGVPVPGSREWCAVKDRKEAKEGAFSVATVCDHVVTLPHGFEVCVPTCSECLAALSSAKSA